MKLLFVLCEGPHDAQFVGRLMEESTLYLPYIEPLKNYPAPLSKFFINMISKKSVDTMRIGKPDFSLLPICAYRSVEPENLVFPIAMGGMDKYIITIKLINEIEEAFAADTLSVDGSDIDGFSILFLFDADSRGVAATLELFVARFKQLYPAIDTEVHSHWIRQRGHWLSAFIFTDKTNDTGVLEDILLDLFRSKAPTRVADTEQHFQTHFEQLKPESDTIAHEAKRKKGILTSCGQMEKKNAGSALTVVLRDTELLSGAFDFQAQDSQWSRLLNRINDTFK